MVTTLIAGFMLVAALVIYCGMTHIPQTPFGCITIALFITTVYMRQYRGLSCQNVKNAFQVAMLLGLAYAATIGGMSTFS